MYPALIEKRKLRIRLSVGAALLVLMVTMQASAQKTTVTVPASTAAKVRQSEIRYVSPVSGKQMYGAYCASCHGVDGKGNAIAAAALSRPPSDLTLLSSRNGGKFPVYRVRELLMDRGSYHDRAAHGMPVWAPAFEALQRDYPGVVQLRAWNLVVYLEKMQAPPPNAGTDPGSSAKHR